MLSSLLALVLAFAPQSISISPNKVAITADKHSAGMWPNWDMTKVDYSTYTITYNTGPNAFLANGFIQVGFVYEVKDNGVTGNPHYDDNFDYMLMPSNGIRHAAVDQFQITNPAGINYTTVSAPVNTSLKLVSRSGGGEKWLQITFLSALPANSTVTITFGDKTQGSQGALVPWNPGRPRVAVFEKFNPNGQVQPSATTFPIILFTADHVTSFIVNLPPVVEVNQPFRFSVQAVQGRDLTPDSGLMPVEDYTGTIHFSCATGDCILPQNITDRTFATTDQSVKLYTATFTSLGYKTIAVDDNALLDTRPSTFSLSNIIKVVDPTEKYKIYIGDLHRHSCEGGHATIPDWMCWKQLFYRGDDFGTVVEHTELYYAGWMHANNKAADAQNMFDPNESSFITFPGYEYGLPGSHRNVTFENITTDPSIASATPNGGEVPPPVVDTTVASFLNDLTNPPTPSIGRIAIVHHSEWKRAGFPAVLFDWGPNLDDPVQRLFEVYSVHGSSEKYFTNPGTYDYVQSHNINLQRPAWQHANLQAALKAGYRFGVIASSDDHSYCENLTGGDDDSGAYCRTGITLVYGNQNIGSLRDRIWNGLMNRHTYATTGPRNYLSFNAGPDTIMGDSIIADSVMFNIDAAVAGIALLDRPNFTDLFIYRDGDTEVLHMMFNNSQPIISQSWVDPSPIADYQYHSYYVKLVQDDNNVVWSSPIWWQIGPSSGH